MVVRDIVSDPWHKKRREKERCLLFKASEGWVRGRYQITDMILRDENCMCSSGKTITVNCKKTRRRLDSYRCIKRALRIFLSKYADSALLKLFARRTRWWWWSWCWWWWETRKLKGKTSVKKVEEKEIVKEEN